MTIEFIASATSIVISVLLGIVAFLAVRVINNAEERIKSAESTDKELQKKMDKQHAEAMDGVAKVKEEVRSGFILLTQKDAQFDVRLAEMTVRQQHLERDQQDLDREQQIQATQLAKVQADLEEHRT